jgi:voltage-gated potassium channel
MTRMLPKRMSPVERRMSKFLREPASVRNAVGVIVTATTVVVVISGITMRLVDPHHFASIWLGMWWSVQTVTTVGYGDILPTDVAGRLVAVVVMLEGTAFVAIVTAAITSTFVARAQRERQLAAGNEETPATGVTDDCIDDLTQRLERIESMIRDLGKP